jgi:hypothetical protein
MQVIEHSAPISGCQLAAFAEQLEDTHHGQTADVVPKGPVHPQQLEQQLQCRLELTTQNQQIRQLDPQRVAVRLISQHGAYQIQGAVVLTSVDQRGELIAQALPGRSG